MKRLLYTLFILIFSLNLALAQNGPQFLNLSSDQDNYSTGQKAVLIAHVAIQPDNPNFELFLAADFNGVAIELTKLTDKEWASVTPTLNDTGSFAWSVRAYVQNKREAAELDGAIAYYEELIGQCSDHLQTTTDPEQIALLLQTINQSNDIKSELEDQLVALRTLVEISTFNVEVNLNHSESFISTVPDPSFFIDTDREDHTYQLGERATLFVHILTNFQGQETVVRAIFGGQDIAVTKSNEKEFISLTDEFVSGDEGDHTYTATIYTRDKQRADSNRKAIQSGTKLRNSYIKKRNATQDPAKKAFFQKKIDEITRIIQTLYEILEDSLSAFGTGNFFVHVGQGGGGGGGNQPPQAIINPDHLNGTAPFQTMFDGGMSFDPDGQIISWDWEIEPTGDSFPNHMPQLEFLFNTPGQYLVHLTVTDNNGAIGTAEALVDVVAGGPVQDCQFKTDYAPGFSCDLAATPISVSSIAGLVAYSQDFGDDGAGHFRSLSIEFDVTDSDLQIHSPCQIFIGPGFSFNANNICIDGREGITGDVNNVFSGQKVTLLSELGSVTTGQSSNVSGNEFQINARKSATIGISSIINVSNLVNLNSSGSDEFSNAVIGSGTNLGSMELFMTAQNEVTIGAGANLNMPAGGRVNLFTNGTLATTKVLIQDSASVVAALLEINSSVEGIIEANTVFNIAQDFIFNASTCSIHPTAQINGPTSGNCFP